MLLLRIYHCWLRYLCVSFYCTWAECNKNTCSLVSSLVNRLWSKTIQTTKRIFIFSENAEYKHTHTHTLAHALAHALCSFAHSRSLFVIIDKTHRIRQKNCGIAPTTTIRIWKKKKYRRIGNEINSIETSGTWFESHARTLKHIIISMFISFDANVWHYYCCCCWWWWWWWRRRRQRLRWVKN